MDSQGRNVIVCDNGTGVSFQCTINAIALKFYWVGLMKNTLISLLILCSL